MLSGVVLNAGLARGRVKKGVFYCLEFGSWMVHVVGGTAVAAMLSRRRVDFFMTEKVRKTSPAVDVNVMLSADVRLSCVVLNNRECC